MFDRLCEEGSFVESEAISVMTQVLSSVQYLHHLGIVHRDLKPENILYYDNHKDSKIMLTDFGLSEYQHHLSTESVICGTPTYLSPEVITGTASSAAQVRFMMIIVF